MLDLYSGPNAPLAKAFNWCGWRVVTPVDLERDAEMDISKPEVRQAIAGCLPQTSCIAAAMSCATKSRAREFPRGLPNLSDQHLLRVTQDNFSSDYAIALQHWGHQHGLACLRENPLRSLHWEDPNEVALHSQGGWFDFDYDACVFLGARRIFWLVAAWVKSRAERPSVSGVNRQLHVQIGRKLGIRNRKDELTKQAKRNKLQIKPEGN